MEKQCKCCRKKGESFIEIYKPLKPTNEPQQQVIDYYLCDDCYNTPYGMH